MIWTGVTASAETETSNAQDTVQAIDAIAGSMRADAVDVASADVTVDIGGASVELSVDPEDGIAVESPGAGDLGIGLPFASSADDAIVVDGAVVYDNNKRQHDDATCPRGWFGPDSDHHRRRIRAQGV